MRDAQMAGQLELRWVPVTDDNGRTHMEACWITVGAQVEAAVGAAA